jgi:hypothetical protein
VSPGLRRGGRVGALLRAVPTLVALAWSSTACSPGGDRDASPTLYRDAVLFPGTSEPCDVHFGWSTRSRGEERLAPGITVTLTLVGVPAGSDVDLGGRPLPHGAGRQVPLAGVPVTLRIGNRECDVLPSGSQPIPYRFEDGSSKKAVTTDAGGAIAVDLACGPDARLAVTAAAEFVTAGEAKAMRCSVFEMGPKSERR